jgi:hypothetical protein
MPAIRLTSGNGSDTRPGCYRHRRMSAGRAAMWIIASGIALAGVVVFAVNGLDGIPGEWWGVAVGALLCGTAFGLGYAE